MIQALEAKRGRGRNDFPISAMWRALMAGIVFQHPSIAALVRELHRNPALLNMCGFDALPRQGRPSARIERDPATGQSVAVVEDAPVRSHVPKGWNFSRLVKNLVELEAEQGLMRGLMDPLRTKLMEVLPDYGVHLGGDGKAVTSHSTGQRSRKTGKYSDPDADWGKHETRGVDRKTGKAWSQVKSWFGYGLHVIADTHHELPVAYRVTRASAAEQPVMKEMLRNRSRRVRP